MGISAIMDCSPGACRVPPSAGYAPCMWGILAGWHRGVGLRADPAQLVPRMGYKGTGYLRLSAGYDVPVAQLLAVYVR